MATKTKAANATRGQKAKAIHDENMKALKNDHATLKALYMQEKDSPVIADILAKAKKFQEYHEKLARDGVGARKTGHKLVDGSDEIENYFLSDSEVAGNMKKSAGIQEMVDYINRMLTPPAPVKKAK